ncbi:ABC transporter permease [Sphingobacterium gobiense]|uniref:Iron ABC transporter permease n=1 Tax=Sphingobacterium gobiense TaxID=1382456 RepID=A0A2S9JNV2_9SPHI|nr:iron chelate uptake ABC transporter family permease subunit [Sphingobacterium gobiense]PRD54669.1 iron ABC transporter permease [Sphingobacterium gobiense]
MKILFFTILLLFLSGISLFVGVADLTVGDIVQLDSEKISLIFVSRIPRTLSLLLAGIGLSVSGLIMQQVTQNKFVSPTTAGTLESAKMGLLAAMAFFPSSSMMIKALFAFCFTFAASLLFLRVVERIRFRNVIFIPLVGLIFGSILNAVSTFFAINLNIMQDMNAWMMGDFSGVIQGRYELIYICLPAVFLTYLYANKFTVVGMGKDLASNLGLNYRMVMNVGLLCVSLTVSTIIITAGAIAFLGLVVPNVVSLVYGDNVKKTLPLVALAGATFLVLCDIIGRLLIYPFEVPIGLTVGIIGGAVFLTLLLSRR